MSRPCSLVWLAGIIAPLMAAVGPVAAADLGESGVPPSFLLRANVLCDEYGRCYREFSGRGDDADPDGYGYGYDNGYGRGAFALPYGSEHGDDEDDDEE